MEETNIIDPTTEDMTSANVTASYIAAGGHMRLFLCYPYFGSDILEHDPLIGARAEVIPSFVTPVLVLILVAVAGVIGAGLAIAKRKRKPVNIVGAT